MDEVEPNVLHYSPESKKFYRVMLAVSRSIVHQVTSWIRDFSHGKTRFLEADRVKLDYKNGTMDIVTTDAEG